MNADENGSASDQGGPVLFGLAFPEVSILYSILYERSQCLPSREEVMDEIERRELYPTNRPATIQAMDCIEDIQDAMRDYLVAFATEKRVKELENRVDMLIGKHRGNGT